MIEYHSVTVITKTTTTTTKYDNRHHKQKQQQHSSFGSFSSSSASSAISCSFFHPYGCSHDCAGESFRDVACMFLPPVYAVCSSSAHLPLSSFCHGLQILAMGLCEIVAVRLHPRWWCDYAIRSKAGVTMTAAADEHKIKGLHMRLNRMHIDG